MSNDPISIEMQIDDVRSLFATLDAEIADVTSGGLDLDQLDERLDVLRKYRAGIRASATGPSATSWPPDDAVVTLTFTRIEWLDLYRIFVAETQLSRELGDPMEGDAELVHLLNLSLSLTPSEIADAQTSSGTEQNSLAANGDAAVAGSTATGSASDARADLDAYRKRLFALAAGLGHISPQTPQSLKLADDLFTAAIPGNADYDTIRQLVLAAKVEIDRPDADLDAAYSVKAGLARKYHEVFQAFDL